MKSPILAIDTKDDRRELWHLLHRLPPGRRAEFIKWAAGRVKSDKGMRPVAQVTRAEVEAACRNDHGDMRLTNSIYGLLLVLGSQWKLDMVETATHLEAFVKRPKTALPSSTGGTGPASNPCTPTPGHRSLCGSPRTN